MGKLHLKRTPEEEAERHRRKKHRKDRKREKKVPRTGDHPFSPSGSRPAEVDPLQGPSTASTSTRASSDYQQHKYKPDYDAIRAQLEEEHFREIFNTFDDDNDERLDSIEARFNDYAHVPDRWQTGATGHRQQGHLNIDEFLQMNPQYMDDEEYAEWIRLGMYRKTHRDEYEEQQREKARKKERREKEKAAREEARKLEKEKEKERKRKREEKEKLRIDLAKERYESRWTQLLRRDDYKEAELGFEDIPWPILVAYPKAKLQSVVAPDAFSLDDFTSDAIANFILVSSSIDSDMAEPDKRERKEKLRDALLRFHPDKFEGRVMKRVRESDKEKVREAVGLVARLLNDLMGHSPQ